MGTTLRSIIISLVLVIAATIFYRFSGAFLSSPDEDELIGYPSFIAHDFSGNDYKEDGKISSTFIGKEVIFFKKDDLLLIDKPELIYYEYTADDSYRTYVLNADNGKVVLNNYAYLSGNITIVPNYDEAFINSIKANDMFYNIKAGIISSKNEIIMQGRNYLNQGTDFSLDLHTKQFKMTGAPHATYYNNNN